MRIVAGKFRRRKLIANPGKTTRPITDRVKERLFERMANDIAGKRVADVFSGTGTMGLEAISRGAVGAVFIENDRVAFDLLKQNAATLEVEDQTLCWRADILRCSFRPRGVDHLTPFDTIFFDPPYKMMLGLGPGDKLYQSLERLARPVVSSDNAVLVVRVPSNAQFKIPAVWEPDRVYDFGSMKIHLFDKAMIADDTDQNVDDDNNDPADDSVEDDAAE